MNARPIPPGHTKPASPEPGNQDERDAEVVRQWLRPDSQVPEGRCPATGCWYTLPLVDGLVVQHSRSGTLNTCLGGGRPPYDPAAAGETGAGEEADEVCVQLGNDAHAQVSPDAPPELLGALGRLADAARQDFAAPSAGQDTERRCGRCGQIPYVHGLPDSTCVYEPTEVAGQDTERLRDELFVGSSIHIHRAGESCNTHCNTPDHPYRKALAELDQTRRERDELMREVERLVDIGSQWGRERDEARAQVQRVEAEVSWLRKADWIPGVSAQLATSVAVRRLRRALDGET